MQDIIWRIAILCFTGFLVWVFKEPFYLVFVLMLIFTRKKEARKSVTQEFDAVHDRLDLLFKANTQLNEKDKQP